MIAMIGSILPLAQVVVAQEERAQITPGERKAPRKKDAGPRALAVMQLTAKGKASLVPIAILINGKFYDATAYKADPVPMALDSGTVYEAERAGSSLGLFTVAGALKSNAANATSPWIGTGSWLPAGTEKPKTAIAAEAVPVGIDTTDEPPRLSRTPSPPKEAPSASTAPKSTSSPPAPAQPTGASGSGDEPPRLTKGTPSPSTPSTGSDPEGKGQSAPGDSNSKPADAKPADGPKAPESDSGAGEANRPRLRRGKPVEALPDDEIPGYSRPGVAPGTAATAGTGVGTSALGPIESIPAISDASGPPPHSFVFEWLKDEEGDRRKQITVLAQDQIRAYVTARAKAKITPKPPGSQAARRSPATQTKEPILENAKMVAYDLWNSNQPIMVFSADAHMPPPPAGAAHGEGDSDMQYSILLVAYPDIYNNLHKLYSGVTDKYHLDVTPRLELLDAVDADGDGRGELLFRQTSDAGTGWIVYRATADKLWKMFDSLNPE